MNSRSIEGLLCFQKQWMTLVLLIFVGLLSSSSALAQVTTATVIGTVTDSQGAAVADAQAVITNTDTNLTRTTTTNNQGEYRFDLLPVGHYTLNVTQSGFKKFTQKDIVLTLNQTATVNVALQIGSVAESVEVIAAPPPVNTSTGELGATVENREIVNLPLVNRDVYQLLELTPGFQRQNMDQTTLGIQQQQTFINGGADGGAGSTVYYLDGGLNMTGVRNTGNALPSPDAVQEFRVQTNSFSAIYGRTNATVVNVLTKSGTNSVHGSVFEFVRNTMFNANDWGNNGSKPAYHRNQFGGTVGGPIKKNRVFFFTSYDGLRQIAPNFRNNIVVPTGSCGPPITANCTAATGLERVGNFAGDPTIKNPIGNKTPTAFAGNRIPANMIDPTSAYIIANYVPIANEGPNQWQGFLAPTPNNYDEGLAKISVQLTSNQQIEGSYFINQGFTIAPQGNLTNWGSENFGWRQQNINLSHTWTFSPTKINQAWLSYTRNFGGRTDLPAISLTDLTAAACGSGSPFFQSTPCSQPHYAIQGTPAKPNISVSGYFSLGNAIAGPKTGTNQTNFRDVFSWNRGRHAFQFGGEVGNDNEEQQVLLDNWGVFNFAGGSKFTGNNLADFELGLQSSQEQDSPVTPYEKSNYYALFAQDDFRIIPRLTLNLGVRWDVQTAPVDVSNLASTFVPGVQSTVKPNAPLGQLFPGDRGISQGIVPTRWHHVQPRLGIAWDPTGSGKTAVRAGFGVFYGMVGGNEWNQTSNFEPFAIRLSTWPNIFTAGKSSGSYASLTNPYNGYTCGGTAQIPFPYPNPSCGAWVAGGPILGISPNFQWPYTYELNFSVQHEFAHGLTLGAAYVGSLAHRLGFATDLNAPFYTVGTITPSTGNVNARRPIDNANFGNPSSNSLFGQVFEDFSNQNSSYNALQLTFTERLGRSFQLKGYYTFSKSFSTVELDNNTPNPTAAGQIPQDYRALPEERGTTDWDRRHWAVISAVWQFNYYDAQNRLLRGFLNGWSVSPIVSIGSGLPFTLTSGSDYNLDGISGNDRPILIPGVSTSISHPNRASEISEWFNTAAFCDNNGGSKNPCPVGVTGIGPNGQDGNVRRNSLYGPGFYQWDMSLFRNFHVYERFSLQARAEATNLFNHPNLGNPGTVLGSQNFGVISDTGTNPGNPMRQLQLGLRLLF